MSRNRNNPLPNPEREEYNRWKQQLVRVHDALFDGTSFEGKLLWVSDYTIGLEVYVREKPSRIMINKGFIARMELVG